MNNAEAHTPEMTGQPVRSLQTMLNQLAIHDPKLLRLAVDGVFGERTLEAVMLFQRGLFVFTHPSCLRASDFEIG